MSAPFCHQFSPSSTGQDGRRRPGGRQIDTGRKTYKLCTKSQTKKREPVWPPLLESALLEGLALYVPTSTKDPRLLLRFPRRNVCISKHIQAKTGKYRTPKQVGSRLQQLRETCCDKYILDLIGSKDFQRDRGSSSERTVSESSFSTSSYEVGLVHSEPTTPTSPDAPKGLFPAFSTQYTTAVALTLYEFDYRTAQTAMRPVISLDLDETALSIPSSSTPGFIHAAEVRSSGPISQCSPVISFTSNRFSTEAQYRCVSDVYIDGNQVYSMPAHLQLCSASSDGMIVYKMELGNDVWAILTRDSDVYSSYTMTQNIFTVSTGTIHDEIPVFSISYTLERGFNAPEYGSTDIIQRPIAAYETQWATNASSGAQPDYGYGIDLSPESPLAYSFPETVDLGYQVPQVPQLSVFYPPSNEYLGHPQDTEDFQSYYDPSGPL
ncbi:hypothetical protein JR316_0008386 [Psilocybe cubensis]|uniref:Uncharacterized protein n=2 Tax=Psilocybe cubensis TaxID=181762 RepID=A0ACB8GW42_PSICU|nr:hypothetical protein JR316_0008386 [Psilocybe cubensis]KAH9479791.1 hypothetical protein JR316_0008386 [Psilocybe cubensis]